MKFTEGKISVYKEAVLAVAALVAGVLVAYINYRIAKHLFLKNSALLTVSLGIHFAVSVSYVVVLFILSRIFSLNAFPVLLGGALGVTLPNFLFMSKLIKINESLPENEHQVSEKEHCDADTDNITDSGIDGKE